MKVLRLILFPFTFIYGFVVILRNTLYDTGILRSFKFDVPVISVGNLSAGGAGKSPLTEYLVQLLHKRYKIAILSRGYGRETSGFYEVKSGSSVSETGDEPLQFKNKFPSVTVAVCESRVTGIRNLQDTHDVIILDDAYQHRAVRPGLNILLFDYSNLMKWQWLLPSGDLREPFWGKKRADCIVITKTPANLGDNEKQQIREKVRPSKNQEIFFSYIRYEKLVPVSGAGSRPLQSLTTHTAVFLLTGIANPVPLVNKIMQYTDDIHHHSYADHHLFTPKNMIKLAKDFHSLSREDRIIITTEKDMQRLKSAAVTELLNGLPVYFLPVKAEIHEPQKAVFDRLIMNYVTEHLLNN